MCVGEHSVESPKPSQPSGETCCALPVAGAQQPLERSAVLRHRRSQLLEPVALCSAADADLASFGVRQVVLGMASARGVSVEIGQQFCGVGTQGVE